MFFLFLPSFDIGEREGRRFFFLVLGIIFGKNNKKKKFVSIGWFNWRAKLAAGAACTGPGSHPLACDPVSSWPDDANCRRESDPRVPIRIG